MSEFIVATNTKSNLELINYALERKDLGDREFGKFILRVNSKSCSRELVNDAWMMNSGPVKVKSQSIS